MSTSQTTLPPDLLDGLDDALVRVRRVLQSPGYRRRLTELLGGDDPLSTLRLVRAVERAGSPPSVGDVAEMLLVDPSTASRSVDDAVARGYLERRACDRDRRRALLHLTARGRRLLQRMAAVRRQLLSDVISDWNEDELADLVRRLRHLLDGLNRIQEAQ